MRLRQLLVIIDPQQTRQPALERAAWLAHKCQAQLYLLLVEYSAALDASRFFDSALQTRARAALLEQRGTWLEELVAPLRAEGLELHLDVRWGKPPHALIEEKVAEMSPDLVLKSMVHDNLLQRLLHSNSCWQLVRHCPVPLWLVQPGEWQGRTLCAALDPLHSADKPAALDHQLIRAAIGLGEQLGLQAHYLHCHAPLPRSLVFDAELVSDYEDYVQRSAAQHREAFEQLLGHYPIALPDTHLIEGFAEEVLPRFVGERQIDLLLLGAIARGHLDTALIGHTAERILESVSCDLLILKPEEQGSAEER
ncbi:universal stress protein [Pseudomonas lalucatii]|uniref:Universal stress protein n=1 Tax=Pseudomonas lalucatii TaxID=1424203 RepID=A0ABS5PZ79_9PSED|nr:universal stress protein [Pseudomonas lalucatii]MBS7661782.1 universal stress protein [Pseudomonas lalucatii]QVM88141.1 universal stress protein [Pseudomonas lalucatii]